MSIKIRNPKIIDDELMRLSKLDLASAELIAPILRHFWKWIKLETEISMSDMSSAEADFHQLVGKGYPPKEVLEFMMVKILSKDLDKPDVKKFIDELTKGYPQA
jgi:hypothetical protein